MILYSDALVECRGPEDSEDDFRAWLGRVLTTGVPGAVACPSTPLARHIGDRFLADYEASITDDLMIVTLCLIPPGHTAVPAAL
jgi:hypothetical protein